MDSAENRDATRYVDDDSSPQNLYTMTLVVTFDTLSFEDTRFKKQYAQHGQHFEILSAFFPPLFYA